jgi:hypothetical protein
MRKVFVYLFFINKKKPDNPFIPVVFQFWRLIRCSRNSKQVASTGQGGYGCSSRHQLASHISMMFGWVIVAGSMVMSVGCKNVYGRNYYVPS